MTQRPGEAAPADARPPRVLFLSQAPIGASVMGHGVAEAAIAAALHGAGVDADVVRAGPWTLAQRAAARPVPGLAARDADLHVPRWHAVEALRGRRLARAALAPGSHDAVLVNSHTLGFGLGGVMARVPTLLSVDTTAWGWHALGIWRPLRRHSRALLRPSLALERRALEGAALVLAWTETVAADVRRAAPRARVAVWHPGLDAERFRPAPRAARERPRVLFVGGRFREKGGEDLLAALGSDWGRVADLDIVSPVTLAPRAGVTVHRLAPGDPALLALYQQADLLCLPSHGDAVPWVVLEALACGTPCVATDVGSMRDLLGGGRAGVLVPREVVALSRELRALLGDDARRAHLGQQGRALVLERFDGRRQGLRLRELLDDTVQRHRVASET